jgi:hypothetical protein
LAFSLSPTNVVCKASFGFLPVFFSYDESQRAGDGALKVRVMRVIETITAHTLCHSVFCDAAKMTIFLVLVNFVKDCLDENQKFLALVEHVRCTRTMPRTGKRRHDLTIGLLICCYGNAVSIV